METRFGVIMLGAPGTGKSTLTNAMQDYFVNVLERPHCIINLDPANEHMAYQCDVDIRELISLFDVMRPEDDDEQPGLGLGPNGAMLYCMQFLETNLDWLVGKILTKECKYFLIDMPGQVELYTNH
jgi:GPN-loop GTPase